MTSYCKHCMIPCEGEVCPVCGWDDVVALLPEDPCFVTEQQMPWAGVLEDVLRQHHIPNMKKPAHGAGLMKAMGGYGERCRFYVPYEYLPAAQELAAELFSEQNNDENEYEGDDLL